MTHVNVAGHTYEQADTQERSQGDFHCSLNEPCYCSGSARCLRRDDSRSSPLPPASRDVSQDLPCYVSYHVKYNYSSMFFPILSWSRLKRSIIHKYPISSALQVSSWTFSYLRMFQITPTYEFMIISGPLLPFWRSLKTSLLNIFAFFSILKCFALIVTRVRYDSICILIVPPIIGDLLSMWLI